MAFTTIEVDERTADLLARLQKKFGVKSNVAVIRQSLALANILSQQADADNTVTIVSEGKAPVKVLLTG